MQAMDGIRDFDFFIGSWTVVHRRLRHRLVGSTDWEVFESRAACRKILDETGNMDEITLPALGCTGMSLRLFDRQRLVWQIWWATSRDGVLTPPVVGRFSNGIGTFEGKDEEGGQAVDVRFTWTTGGPKPTWEQAFSVDGGRTWESNWVMEFTRLGG